MPELKIIVVSSKDEDLALVELQHLSPEASIIAIGRNLQELLQQASADDISHANVLFCATGTKGKRDTIEPIINSMPHLVWIQSITTGLDHFLYEDLINNPVIQITNSKTIFSMQIAEFVIASIFHFAKDIPRLLSQKQGRNWERFTSPLLGDLTLGIIGYGEIGMTIASMAKAFNMKIIASRKTPELSHDDPNLDEVYRSDQYMEIVTRADFLVIATPLTPETVGMINAEVLNSAKQGQVIINVGRGKVIVESDLIEALEQGTARIRGAALDVYSIEPLPIDSKLWTLQNVLISPHNAFQVEGVRNEAFKLFCANCLRFLKGEKFPDLVDKRKGY